MRVPVIAPIVVQPHRFPPTNIRLPYGVNIPRSVQRLGPPHLATPAGIDAALAAIAAGPAGLAILGGPGVGKSALARGVLERLHADGWAVAAVTGRWYPVGLFDNVADAVDTFPADAPHEVQFAHLRELLERTRFALLFDDVDRDLSEEGYADPGFAEALDRLCRSAERGRVLVTSRTALPHSAGTDRLTALRLEPTEAAGAELAAALPHLSTMDATVRERVVAAVAGHPRSLRLVDAWLGAPGRDPSARLADLLRLDTAPLELVLAELTDEQREALLQIAIATFPWPGADERLTELGLLHTWPGPSSSVDRRSSSADRRSSSVDRRSSSADRWIAEALAPHQGDGLAGRHEQAITLHYANTRSEHGTIEDYVAVTRHLAAVADGMGDLTKFTLDFTRILGEDNFTAMALLGEVAAIVPAGNGHYLPLRERQIRTLIRLGFPGAALEVGERAWRAVSQWAPTHPQRDEARFWLGKAHNIYGVALLRCDEPLAAKPIFAAEVDIYHELATEHPTSIEAQHRLGYALEHLGDVYLLLDRPEDEEDLFRTLTECVFVRTQLFQATPGPEAALVASPSFQRLADLAERTGDRENAHRLLGTRLAMVEAMAAAFPDDEELAAELPIARESLAALSETS